MASMSTVTRIMITDLKSKLDHQAHITAFEQKVLAVLLGEVLSSTVYEILTVAIVGDGSLSNAQALIARSIYAVLVSIYSPVMGWLLSKRSRGKDTFISIALQGHASICPVLLAWGWKDWAAALQTFIGAELWDEVVVAVVLTALVTAAQAAPCFSRSKASIAAGGDEDTLMARFLTVPSGFALTLGYVWNVVTTYFVGNIQKLEDSYHFDFMVQGIYSLIACIFCTAITVCLKKRGEPLPASKSERTLGRLSTWSGMDTGASTLNTLVCTTLSFIYGWAMLDVADDWGFGVMFQCSSYSACSYQSNFVYALCVTITFALASSILNQCKQQEDTDIGFAHAVELQLNGMILTVGWAWMNFYSTNMSDVTKGASGGHTLLLYIGSLVAIVTFHSLTEFVLHKSHKSYVQRMKQAIEELDSGTVDQA